MPKMPDLSTERNINLMPVQSQVMLKMSLMMMMRMMALVPPRRRKKIWIRQQVSQITFFPSKQNHLWNPYTYLPLHSKLFQFICRTTVSLLYSNSSNIIRSTASLHTQKIPIPKKYPPTLSLDTLCPYIPKDHCTFISIPNYFQNQ